MQVPLAHRPGRHPLDPPAPHRAAPVLGRLVASGLLAREDALDALLHAPAPGVARQGLQARLTHALDDAARAHALRRAAAGRAIGRALAPLLLARAPRAALMAAAAAADPDGHLLPRERAALVRDEVAAIVLAARRP